MIELYKNKKLIKIEESFHRNVKTLGNSGMVRIPKRYIGQEAIVCILPNEEKYGEYEIINYI